ncbi:MAG: methyltransferase domain-containing protein [Candidatus Omnitrophota bacterium]
MALRAFTDESLEALLKSRIESLKTVQGELSHELNEYLRVSFNRISHTLGLIKKFYRQEKGSVLEIGCFPYFLTTALLEFSDDTLTGISAPKGVWPGGSYDIKQENAFIRAIGKVYQFPYWQLNAEKDRFPFADKTFDMVLCSEVLEHLIHSPAHMICEINRVLKDNGVLILTTPNGLFWKYLYKLFFYGSWEPYSKYGVYGRHNRLWALNEACDILEGNNLKVIHTFSNYSRDNSREFMSKKHFTLVNLAQDLGYIFFGLLFKLPVAFFQKKKGDQLYIVARKTAEANRYCPGYLYDTNFIYNVE